MCWDQSKYSANLSKDHNNFTVQIPLLWTMHQLFQNQEMHSKISVNM